MPAAEAESAPLTTFASCRSVSIWVVCLAVITDGASDSEKLTGAGDTFHTRAIIPWPIPSSAGLSAHSSTFGSEMFTREKLFAGYVAPDEPITVPVTKGF